MRRERDTSEKRTLLLEEMEEARRKLRRFEHSYTQDLSPEIHFNLGEAIFSSITTLMRPQMLSPQSAAAAFERPELLHRLFLAGITELLLGYPENDDTAKNTVRRFAAKAIGFYLGRRNFKGAWSIARVLFNPSNEAGAFRRRHALDKRLLRPIQYPILN